MEILIAFIIGLVLGYLVGATPDPDKREDWQ